MAGKPFVSQSKPESAYYTLPAEVFHDLCVVRDELRLFAAMAAQRANRHPEMMVYRNTLAHCFEHLAKQVERVVHVLRENPTDDVDGTFSRRYRRKN